MVLWPFLSCGFSIKYIHSFIHYCYTTVGAADMYRLGWDTSLAQQAAAWASHCLLKHDDQAAAETGSMTAGQNVYAHPVSDQQFDVRSAVQTWYR